MCCVCSRCTGDAWQQKASRIILGPNLWQWLKRETGRESQADACCLLQHPSHFQVQRKIGRKFATPLPQPSIVWLPSFNTVVITQMRVGSRVTKIEPANNK